MQSFSVLVFAGLIIVFNQSTSKDVLRKASRCAVDVKRFDVIYHLVDYLKTTLSDMADQQDSVVLGKKNINQFPPK